MNSEEMETLAISDEDAQLIQYLRSRCKLLNLEIRQRDQRIIELEATITMMSEPSEASKG